MLNLDLTDKLNPSMILSIKGFGIGFWKSWELTLVMMSLTPVLAIAGSTIMFVSNSNQVITKQTNKQKIVLVK